MLRLHMLAVWPKPCSASTARSMPSSHDCTRTSGMTGISCSVQTSGCSSGTSTSASRTSLPAEMPISRRMSPAYLPTHCLSVTPGLRGAPISLKMTRSSARSRCDGTSTAPLASIAALSRSATLSTTKISFSSVQMTLLSKPPPKVMSRPALSMSAVSSTTTGGLPGPAQTARLPLLMASLTTPGPPVTINSRMPGWRISSCALAMVGSAMAVSRLAGPPAPTTARLMSWIW